MTNAYVLEVATGTGDALVVVATSVDALRRGWESDSDAEYYVLRGAARDLGAIDEEDAGRGAVFRIWLVRGPGPASPYDLRHRVRLSEGEVTTTLDAAAALAALGGPSRATRVEIDWEGITASVPPLEEPHLGHGEDLFVDTSALAVGASELPPRLALGVTTIRDGIEGPD